MNPLQPIKRSSNSTPIETLTPPTTGSGNISPGYYSTSPVSPIIHPTHIHPGEVTRSPLVSYDIAPGSISFSHSTTPSQDLQDILEQFDPLGGKKRIDKGESEIVGGSGSDGGKYSLQLEGNGEVTESDGGKLNQSDVNEEMMVVGEPDIVDEGLIEESNVGNVKDEDEDEEIVRAGLKSVQGREEVVAERVVEEEVQPKEEVEQQEKIVEEEVEQPEEVAQPEQQIEQPLISVDEGSKGIKDLTLAESSLPPIDKNTMEVSTESISLTPAEETTTNIQPPPSPPSPPLQQSPPPSKDKQKAIPTTTTPPTPHEKHPSTTINPIIKDEDVKPFDFQRFLDQLRHKSADPIARYVKSFLSEFNKRIWNTSEQVKIITDFKSFISVKMTICPPFSTLSDSEMINALEGMEKLIMNRLYTKTFSPEIPVNQRDDIHEEDILRDRVLQEKMRIWHWIEGRHLDLADRFLRNGEAFVKLASDELLKINHYRAPRDKVICVLNCCKVIFGLLRQTNSEQSADGFLPILIYVVIKAQPKDLISNINYIQRFRNQDMLRGETGYYLSSLSGAISFIESLDRSGLSVSDEEFEINVENSVKSIAEPADSSSPPRTPARGQSPVGDGIASSSSSNLRNINDVNTTTSSSGPLIDTTVDNINSIPNPSSINTNTSDITKPSRPITPQSNLNASTVLYQSAGLFAAPFKSLSKMFEVDPNAEESTTATTTTTTTTTTHTKSPSPSPEESAARQVSAEEHEAQRISQVEFENVCKTLTQMFPTLDEDVIQDVLQETQGRVGAAVDLCLSLLE